MTSLSEALGRPVEFGWATERLVAGFREFFHVDPGPLALTAEDEESIAAIERTKYGDDRWTLHGRSL
jgi:lipoate-protein ligase A